MIPERGAWLLDCARARGYDATRLGKAVNASRQRVGTWFKGGWPWRIEHRHGLRRVLGISEEMLRNGPWSALTAPGATRDGAESDGDLGGAMLTGHIPPEGTTLQPPAEAVKDGQPTVAERGASVSGSVLAHWNRIVGAVPFWDLIGLVAAEIDYLERRLKETGNPRILAALSEARLLKEQLQRMGEPHQILRPHDKPSP